jgi:hypothetical protein
MRTASLLGKRLSSVYSAYDAFHGTARRAIRVGKFRVFISYAHVDRKLARHIVEHLEGIGVRPLWDVNIARGHHFHDQIKTFIRYSHVFLPIVTKAARKAGWVHQEIGYAVALNVPVLPVALDDLPGEMMSELQAVVLRDEEADLAEMLPLDEIELLVRTYSDPLLAQYQCAPDQETRTKLLCEYADEVSGLRQAPRGRHFGKVRQRAALSSFHIPDKPPDNPIWERHAKDRTPSYLRRLLRAERRALERHAREKGCKLIICPEASREAHRENPASYAAGLEELLEFLRSMDDADVRIAIGPKLKQGENMTIVGGWFSANSIVGDLEKGYRQTIFTRHAPTVGDDVAEFDAQFDQFLMQNPWPRAASERRGAIEYLQAELSNLELRDSTV